MRACMILVLFDNWLVEFIGWTTPYFVNFDRPLCIFNHLCIENKSHNRCKKLERSCDDTGVAEANCVVAGL